MQESQSEKITLENDDAFSEEMIHKKVKLFADAWYTIPKRATFRTTKTVYEKKQVVVEKPSLNSLFPNLNIPRFDPPLIPLTPVSERLEVKEVTEAKEVPDERFKDFELLLDKYSNTIPSTIRERKKAERKIYSLLMIGQKEGRISGVIWQPVEIAQYVNLQGRLTTMDNSLKNLEKKLQNEIRRIDERIDGIDRDDNISSTSLQGDVSANE